MGHAGYVVSRNNTSAGATARGHYKANADAGLHTTRRSAGVNLAVPAGERRQRRIEAKARPFKTFSDLAETYFTACEVGEWKPRKKKKRASTLKNEKWLWARHIKPDLGDLLVENVTPAAIRTVLRKLVATKRESTSNKVRAQIRQIFNFAISEERVEINPVARTTALHDEAPRQRVLIDDEIRQIWTALSERTGLVRKGKPASESRVLIGEPVSIALKLLLVTLVRRAEVSGAARSELDLDNGIWLIPGSRTKSGKPHLVPLSQMAIDLFRRAIAVADAGQLQPSAYVFPSPRDRGQPITPAALTHALRYTREALELERLTPHDLRRTGATNMASERMGVSPFLIGKVLSHSTELGGAAAVTLTTYALYDYVKEKRDALAAWADLLTRIVQGGPIDPPATKVEADVSATISDDLRRRVADDPAFRQALIAELLGAAKT